MGWLKSLAGIDHARWQGTAGLTGRGGYRLRGSGGNEMTFEIVVDSSQCIYFRRSSPHCWAWCHHPKKVVGCIEEECPRSLMAHNMRECELCGSTATRFCECAACREASGEDENGMNLELGPGRWLCADCCPWD